MNDAMRVLMAFRLIAALAALVDRQPLAERLARHANRSVASASLCADVEMLDEPFTADARLLKVLQTLAARWWIAACCDTLRIRIAVESPLA